MEPPLPPAQLDRRRRDNFPCTNSVSGGSTAETSTSPTSLAETDLADWPPKRLIRFATPEYSPDHIIEFHPQDPSPSIEEVDLTACYGVDKIYY